MLIEKAAQKDYEQVVALLGECGLPTGSLQPEHMDSFWVAKSGRCLVGIAGMLRINGVGIGHSLAVLPGFRSMGLGRRLVATLFDACNQESLSGVYLFTCNAEFYFRALGFHVVAHSNVPGPVVDALTGLCDKDVVMGGHILYLPLKTSEKPVADDIADLALLA